MKRTLYFVVLLFLAAASHQSAFAQAWVSIGDTSFTPAEADYESIAIAPDGTPYVAFLDYAHSFKASVMKFTGTGWVFVGSPGFSADVADFTNIAIDRAGTPYVTYTDGSAGQRVTVMKFDGATWAPVGAVGISASEAANPQLNFDSAGTVYVSYIDDSLPVGDGGPISVKKFVSGGWQYVGPPRFTPLSNFISAVMYHDTLYIAYQNGNALYRAAVTRFNGTAWAPVGPTVFSPGVADYLVLAIDSGGAPYVAYADMDDSGKISVAKFDGAAWNSVGPTHITPANADVPALALDPTGHPWILYPDPTTPDYFASVIRYNDTGWVPVGVSGFSGTLMNYPALAIGSTGKTYASYQGFVNGKKATVMSFDTSAISTGVAQIPTVNAQPEYIVYPNPATTQLTIALAGNATNTLITTITITNMPGQTLLTRAPHTMQANISIASLAAGSYFLTINGNRVIQFVKR